MGSLPNLYHVLDRREREKEKVLARERAREREFCHDLDSWRVRALSMQVRQYQRTFAPQRRVIRTRSSGNTHHLTDEPLENLSFLAKPGSVSAKSHRMSPQQRACQLPSLPVPNYSLGPQILSAQSSSNNQHHYHHHNIIQPQSSNPISRRRESANSSIGSMRRLLTVNRGCRHKIPVHVRANVIKNFIFLVIAHGLISTTLLPLISLQASNSIWFEMRQSYSSVITTGAVGTENDNTTDTTADDNIVRGVSMSTPAVDGAESGQSNNILLGPPNEIGSLLLSMTFLLTSGMCFLTALAIKKMGHYLVVFCSYVGVALFLICHLWPTYYTLFPGYLVLGVVFGPLCISKLNLVILMANKLSCGQHECCNAVSTPTVNPSATGVDGTDEHILFAKPSCCSRDENIRRLARWFHLSQNFGIICGSIIISLLLTCAAFQPIVSNRNLMMTSQPQSKGQNKTTAITKGDIEYTPAENFDTNNHGQRICGAASCPVWWMHTSSSAYVKYIQSSENATGSGSLVHRISPRKSSNIRTQGTIVVYLILAIVAIVFTVFIGKFTNKKNMTGSQHQYFRYNSVPGLIDTLFFAGPMAYFIGTEQGYILADFMKAFVSCSLGPHMVAGALIGMGIMQLIASSTLSMLLSNTKRIVVIIAGSFFHACLLLVLSRWKPSTDDSALFYVIAAAWGVCHSVWDTLLFTLMSLTHKNHMLEVLAPIHGLQYLAMGITFGAHGFLCEYAKIIVLAILLVVSVPPYTSLEMRLEAQRKVAQNSHAKSVLQIPTL